MAVQAQPLWLKNLKKRSPKANEPYLALLWKASLVGTRVDPKKLSHWAIRRMEESKGACQFGLRDMLKLWQWTRDGKPVKNPRPVNLAKSLAQKRMTQFLDDIDPRKRMPVYKAEVKCPKCGLDATITPLAIQTRSGDEMQVMHYKCSNHTPPHLWKV